VRTFPVSDRAQSDLSHTRPSWAIDSLTEGDVIVGPAHRSAIGTLVERQSRVVKLIHLERADSFTLHQALVRELASLPR
jgi:IS30 family transposase